MPQKAQDWQRSREFYLSCAFPGNDLCFWNVKTSLMSSWAYSPSPSECHPQMDISGAKSDKTWELLSATNPSVNTADLKSDLDHLPLTVLRTGTQRQTVHQLLSQAGVSGGNGCWFCLSWLSELNSQSMVGSSCSKEHKDRYARENRNSTGRMLTFQLLQ